MAMGRPPKPTEQKRRLGNPGKRALPAPITTLPGVVEIPKPPASLRRHGKAAWQRYWGLGAAWLSPTTDVEVLTRLCQAYDEREQLRASVRKYGHVVAKVLDEEDLADGGGPVRVYDMKANPAVGQLRKLEELITRYEGLCGFNPSDRSRLGLAEVKKASALDQLMARQSERRAARRAPSIETVEGAAVEQQSS